MAGKRNILYLLVGLGLLVFLGLTAGSYWVMATSRGSAWLVRTLVGRMPETVAVQSIEGRLSDAMVLSGVTVRWEGGQASIKRLAWRWRATGLLPRHLRIRALHLEEVHLVTAAEQDQPLQPLNLSWPALPDWLGRVRITLEDLQIRRLSWKFSDTQSFYLEGLAARAKWARRRLHIPLLVGLCEAGALTARARIDWREPGLWLQAASLARPDSRTDLPVLLALGARPGDFGKLTGSLRLGGHAPVAGGVLLTTPFVLAPTALSFDNVDLSLLSARGSLHGKATIDWAETRPRADLTGDFKDMDLAYIAGQQTRLSGSLALHADPEAFGGRLALSNNGADWRNLRLETAFSGDRETLSLTSLRLSGLEGVIEGSGVLRWTPQLEARGTFNGRNLNPEAAGLAWPGDINLQGQASWSRRDAGQDVAAVQVRLLPSTLRGYPLRGRIEASMQDGDVDVASLELKSRGVDLAARGRLRQRIDFRAAVEDLAGLLPGVRGALQGRGWLRWRDGQVEGKLDATARALQRQELAIQQMQLAASLAQQRAGQVDIRVQGLNHGGFLVPSLALSGQGSLERHNLTARLALPRQAELALALDGGYASSRWQGRLTDLTLRDAVGVLRLATPAALALSGKDLSLAPMQLEGGGQEQLSASAKIHFTPLTGQAQLDWRNLRLAHAQDWLPASRIAGRTSGRASWRQRSATDFEARAELQAVGSFEGEGLRLEWTAAETSLSWTPARLQAAMEAVFKQGGRLEGTLQGGPGKAFSLPGQARWQVSWQDLNLQPFASLLPAGTVVKGRLTGRLQGDLSGGRQLAADGELAIADGEIVGRGDHGQIRIPVQNATIALHWREAWLRGRTDLQLGEYGRLHGTFRLPVPARLPVRISPEGELDIAVDGRSSELGLLTALLPGAVQESRGRLELELRGRGTWAQPQLSGTARLLDAGAYLPVAGIELRKVALLARLDKDRVLIDNLALQSGEGTLQGQGSLQLRDWKPADYDLTLKGHRVQLINLPELQVMADPDLQLHGTASGLRLTGTVKLPEVLIRDNKKPSVITPSDDVVLVGQPVPEKTAGDFHIRSDIRLLLGDHVLVKAYGLDVRLTGELRLTDIGAEAMTAEGRISVAEGLYAAYGTRLDITRGNLLFHGPLDQPALDIVALRTVGKVKAGVQVSGTPRAPVVKLTSDPAMSDSDRLAYIILGRASARNAGEADLLMTAGGLLLSQGESVVMRDRLKRQLGVDVLGFEAGGGSGVDDVAGSMLTIGKYLSPSLYVSIGQSLFSNTQEFRLRYSLGKHWELESATGEESGVDLFYKIEFR